MLRKILISLLALTALCAVAAGVAWYLLGNEAFLKRQLHATVLRATGRSLRVEGALRLSLGSTTTIEARDVHFSNPGWAVEPDMLTVGQLHASVDLRSLFGSQTVIHDLELNDCRLALIENELGEKNWNLLPQSVEKDALSEDGEPEAPPFRLNHLHISHCQLTADAPQRAQTLSAVIAGLALDRLENGGYRVQADGQVADRPLAMSGQLGPLESLWQGGPFEHDIEFRVGEILLHSSGSVADALTGRGANVSMRFSGPEFARVTDYLAVPAFSSGAFDFSLQFRTEGETTVLDVNGDLGSFDLLVSGELDRLLRPTAGEVHMTATGPDLDTLGQLFGIHGLAQEPFTFKSDARFKDGRMSLTPALLSTSQDRIELKGELSLLPGLPEASLDFTLQSDDIGRWFALWGRPITSGGAFSATGHVTSNADGLLSGQAEIQHRASHLKVSGSIGQLPVPKQPDLDFEFDSPNLNELAGLTGVDDLPVAPAKAKGHFSLDDTGAYFRTVTVGLADNRAKIDGTLIRTAHFAGSEFTVSLNIPSTSSLGLLFGYSKLPDKPLKVNATLKPAGKGLEFQVGNGSLGEIKLSLKGSIADLSMPSSIDADLAIELPSARLLDFLLPQTELPDLPLAIGGGVSHHLGSARLQQVRLTLGTTRVNLDGEVHFSPAWVGTRLTLSGNGADLGEWIRSRKLDALPKAFSFSGQWSKETQAGKLEAEVQLGTIKAALSGTLDSLFAPGDMALQAQLDMPDASVLNAFSGQFLAAQPLSASSRIEGSLEEFTLSNLSLQHGASQISGDLQVKAGEQGRLSGSLHADVLDLRPWINNRTSSEADSETANVRKTSGSTDMIFGDDPVIGVGKHAFELDLDIGIDRAELVNTVIEDIRLGLLMLNDELRLDPLEMSDRRGSSIAGKLALDGTGSLPFLEIELHGKDLRLGLFGIEGQDLATYPPTDVEINLHGKGGTWHEMASSLNGTLQIFHGKGLVAPSAFKFIFSDFVTNLFRTLNPSASPKNYTQLICSVIAAEVVSGQVEVNPIIMQTKEVTTVSSGTIDLGTERIDLTFNSKARKGLGLNAGALINPFVKVGGTLAYPAMELAPAKAAISGGAAVATGGLSVLAKSLTDRFLSSRDPCGDARKKLAQQDKENR